MGAVRLASLTLEGFKSFATRVELSFPGALIAIVIGINEEGQVCDLEPGHHASDEFLYQSGGTDHWPDERMHPISKEIGQGSLHTLLYPALLATCFYNRKNLRVVRVPTAEQNRTADKKIFSQIALCFALIFAGIITADYFLQLTVVLPSILSKETEGLSLFSMYNPHGIFVSLESLGYLLMNSALLALAGVFVGKNKVEFAIRWIFLIAFILAVISFGVIILAGYPIVFFEVAIITINVIVLIASGVLLSLFFRRIERTKKI
jgi:hypothetical protein